MPRFNPRVRAGRDITITKTHLRIFVSIHASARDATAIVDAVNRLLVLFQSTRPRGTRRHADCQRL